MDSNGGRGHRTTTGSKAGKAFATVASIAAALAGGIACLGFLGGVAGIACGAVVAALLYLGVGIVLEPQAKLDGVSVEGIPDGEAAALQVSQARELCRELSGLSQSVRDGEVRREVSELVHDIGALASFVEKQPSAHRRLAHFLNVYGEQCAPMIRGYMAVENGAGTDKFAAAQRDAIDALNALEGAAQGELERAMSGKVTELSASSESVRRLMEMDGYQTDARLSREPDVEPAPRSAPQSAPPGALGPSASPAWDADAVWVPTAREPASEPENGSAYEPENGSEHEPVRGSTSEPVRAPAHESDGES